MKLSSESFNESVVKVKNPSITLPSNFSVHYTQMYVSKE